MPGYLMDTSVFIAAEQKRPIAGAPVGQACVSVVTLTELDLGVRRALDDRVLRRREATLERARSFIALPYDERVGVRLAELLAAAATHGRRAGAMDAIIAATALAHDLTVWTQDDDFAVLAELAPTLRVHAG